MGRGRKGEALIPYLFERYTTEPSGAMIRENLLDLRPKAHRHYRLQGKNE